MSNYIPDILYVFVASILVTIWVSYYLSKRNVQYKGNFWFNAYYVLIIVVILYIVLWSFAKYEAFINFDDDGYDTAIYDQSLWHMSRFEIPFSSLKGFNQLGDHFSVILFLLVPLYWICPHVLTLLITQHIIVALGAFPIYLIARVQLKSNLLGIAFAISYLSFLMLQKAIHFGFHPITMSPTFIAFAVYFILRYSWWKYTVFILLALMCKEDVSVTTGALGLYILIFTKKRLVGVLTILVSVIWFTGTIHYIMPKLMGEGNEYYYFTGPSVFRDLVLHPVRTISTILSDTNRIEVIMSCLFPTLGMCLLSPFILVATPVMLVKLYLLSEVYHTINLHHGAPLAATITISAIFGCAYMQRFLDARNLMACKKIFFAIYVTLFCIILSIMYHVPIHLSHFYKSDPTWQAHNEARWKVLRQIPDECSVSVNAAIFPKYLSHRDGIYLLKVHFDSEYAMIDTLMVRRNGRMRNTPRLGEELARRTKAGYKIVTSRDGVYLLKRGSKNDTGTINYK